MRMRQLAQRMKRIEQRMPQPEDPVRFRIAFVNPDRSVAGYILIENGTQRHVGPDGAEIANETL